MMMSREVMRVFHEKMDMRHIVIPGARMVIMVVMKLTAPIMVPKPDKPSPKTHMFAPTPGVYVAEDNGA